MYWSDPYGTLHTVDIDLYGEESPRHVANFLRFVETGAYDHSYIHRTQSMSSRFLQGGSFYVPSPFSINAMDAAANRIATPYRPVDNEFDASNGLSNIPGTLAAARTDDPDSATAGWFFNVTNNASGFDPGPYTVFGEVTSGWDAFAQLASQPVVSQLDPRYKGRPFDTAPFMPGPFGNYYLPVLEKWTQISLIPGDFNLDGIVDAADEAVWQASQGTFGIANLVADADGDGDVDQADRAIWQANLGMGQLKNVAGDYNGNGVVTAADYLWWSTLYGTTAILDADGNGDGKIDGKDYLIWRNAYEAAGGLLTPQLANVPEPASVATLAGLVVVGLAIHRRIKK
jgi:cyclophilin family peptidyl-prolyl cis-trans isomerase